MMAKYTIRYTTPQTMPDDIVSITWDGNTRTGKALLLNGNTSVKNYPMTRQENVAFMDMVFIGETKSIEPGRILIIEN
jgi:ribosomal protein L2